MRAVIKIGGSVLGETAPAWVSDLEALQRAGYAVALVHGGGPRISEVLRASDEPVTFWQGQRVTNDAALKVVVGVLAGEVNTDLVLYLKARGISAAGLSGTDGRLLQAEMAAPQLGRVGRVVAADPQLLMLLMREGYTPVMAPVASDVATSGAALNVNGDWAAAHVAAALRADLLVFHTDVGGVRQDPQDPASTIPLLDTQACRQLVATGVAVAGMVPKLEAAVYAIEHGVGQVRIGQVLGETSGTRVAASMADASAANA